MKLTEIIRQLGGSLRLASRVTALTGGTATVDSVVVTAGGTGYATPPTVNFSSGAAAATATVASGSVISVAVTAGGSYVAAPTVSFMGGGGSGATASVVMLATSLDAIPTLTLTVGTFVFFMFGGALNIYELVSTTAAESVPERVRGDDYAVTTNEKAWEWRGILHIAKALTYSGTTNLDFLDRARRILALTGDITFTTSNLVAGRSLELRIAADGTPRNFTFPAWVFVGAAAPASIAASKKGLLRLVSWGTTDADVTATWDVEP